MVHRLARLRERALGEVLQVVVDVVVDLVLGPGRGRLHEPGVLVVVVGELHRVEELVRGGHLEVLDRGAGELRVVVVEGAVGPGVVGAVGRRCGVAVAVAVGLGTEVREVDVEQAVATAAGAVGLGRAVARVDVGLEHVVDDVADLVDVVGVDAGAGLPVHADVTEVARLVGRRAGEQRGRGLLVGRRELAAEPAQVAHGQGQVTLRGGRAACVVRARPRGAGAVSDWTRARACSAAAEEATGCGLTVASAGMALSTPAAVATTATLARASRDRAVLRGRTRNTQPYEPVNSPTSGFGG